MSGTLSPVSGCQDRLALTYCPSGSGPPLDTHAGLAWSRPDSSGDWGTPEGLNSAARHVLRVLVAQELDDLETNTCMDNKQGRRTTFSRR